MTLNRISIQNPKNEPPNSSFPMKSDNAIIMMVRYDANPRKLTRGRIRRSTKLLDPCDFSKDCTIRGDSNIRRAIRPMKSVRR